MVMNCQPDEFRCGLCGEETSNIVDFLHHKAQHAAPSAGISCEFCKISYKRHITLREHYRLKHRITLPTLPATSKPGALLTKLSVQDDLKQDHVRSTEQGALLSAEDSMSGCSNISVGDTSSDQDCDKSLTVGCSHDANGMETVHVIVENGNIMQLPMAVINVPLSNEFNKSLTVSHGGDSVQTSHAEYAINSLSSDATEIMHGSSDGFPISNANSRTFTEVQQSQEEFSINTPKESMQDTPEDFPIRTSKSPALESLQGAEDGDSMNSSDSQPAGILQEDEYPIAALTNSTSVGDDHGAGVADVNKNQGTGVAALQEPGDLELNKAALDKCVTLDNLQTNLDQYDPSENQDSTGDQCKKEEVHIIVEKSDTPLPVDRAHLLDNDQSLPIMNGQLVDNQRILNVYGPGHGDASEIEDLKSCQSNGKIITAKSGRTKKENIKDDFHFILMTDVPVIVGKSLTYQKQVFRCIHCDFRTYWKNMLCHHMQQQHKDTLCIHQALQIKSINTSENQSVMKMSEYNTLRSMIRNKAEKKRLRGVEKQDIIGIHVCPKCNKTFNRLRYLRKHLATHAVDQKYLCDECGKAFKTQAYLKQHRKVHQKEPYRCSQCEFTSANTTAIQAHRQIHNQKCVLCDICGAAYNAKSTLNKHMKVHDPGRKYACTFPGCTWRFRTEMMCKAHIKNHTTKGKFRCTRCGYMFRHKHHLQRHEASQHGVVVTKPDTSKVVAEKDKSINMEEIADSETVNLIVDSDIDTDHLNLQNALQNSQLVIATDSEGNTYEMATDIAMNVAYQTLLQGADGQTVDTQAILIPQSSDCSHIVLQETIAESQITESV